MKQLFSGLLTIFLFTISCQAQTNQDTKIIPGADRINVYLPFLKGKKVGIFANQTSMVGNTHLVDTLRKLGVDIKLDDVVFVSRPGDAIGT